MIRPIQMTNEIISDTKVIFARGNAVIQITRFGCPALPVELAALEGVACALATVSERVRGPRARHRLLRRSLAIRKQIWPRSVMPSRPCFQLAFAVLG